MSMSFEESLKKICNEIFPSPEDCQSFNEDAKAIRNKLIKEMKEYDSLFNEAFDGISLPEIYMHRLKNNLPEEFECYIKLKMPFSITSCPGFIVLNANLPHPIVHNDRICCRCLQDWIRKILTIIISNGIYYSINGRIYMIEYPKNGRGYDVAHTILAKEVVPGKRMFSFDLVPAFELKKCKWLHNKDDIHGYLPLFAVPFGKKVKGDVEMPSKEFFFMMCEPQKESKMLQDKPNLINSLRLMKAVCSVIKMKCLTVVKINYICEIQDRPDEFYDQPIGVILIEMLEILLMDLSDANCRFFYEGFNNIDPLSKHIRQYSALDFVFINLSKFQHEKTVNYDDIAALFVREQFEKKYGTACLLFTLICDKSNRDSNN